MCEAETREQYTGPEKKPFVDELHFSNEATSQSSIAAIVAQVQKGRKQIVQDFWMSPDDWEDMKKITFSK